MQKYFATYSNQHKLFSLRFLGECDGIVCLRVHNFKIKTSCFQMSTLKKETLENFFLENKQVDCFGIGCAKGLFTIWHQHSSPVTLPFLLLLVLFEEKKIDAEPGCEGYIQIYLSQIFIWTFVRIDLFDTNIFAYSFVSFS